MPKHDKVHFDQYSSQTRAKHAILSGYLPAYLRSLKNKASWFHYVDGFAGPGVYVDRFQGSPLLALQFIDDEQLTARATVSLIEDIRQFYEELQSHVRAYPSVPRLAFPPLIRLGKFADHLPAILTREVYSSRGGVATFAFVDPCGVDGVRMANLVTLLALQFGEVLLFFNYSAVTRMLGGIHAGTHDDRVLMELFGNREVVSELVEETRMAQSVEDRELSIRDHFVKALKQQSAARFFVPFRFESKAHERTSHYLIHCCDDPLGFKIMKHVMWELVREGGDEYGRLEFLRDKERGVQFDLFRTDIESQKDRILRHLAKGPVRVREFSTNWMGRPTDPFSEKVYKLMLMNLEGDKKLFVFDKNNAAPYPAEKRRKDTLGDDYWLRLAESGAPF